MSFRKGRRAVALAWALGFCFIRFAWMRLQGPLTAHRRALWLQGCCRHVLASLGIRFSIEGRLPSEGLVVSNHLSYLDILIFSAAMPCTFISKAEVKRWPFFGWAARTGGTLFLDRSSRASAACVAQEMSDRLRVGVPTLLFPEGTSSDGAQVLRFHATLFQPAITVGTPVTAAAVRYEVKPGRSGQELCWFGDDTFLSHLSRTLDAPGFSGVVCFGEPHTFEDRRYAAIASHEAVTAMRSSLQRNEEIARDEVEPGWTLT